MAAGVGAGIVGAGILLFAMGGRDARDANADANANANANADENADAGERAEGGDPRNGGLGPVKKFVTPEGKTVTRPGCHRPFTMLPDGSKIPKPECF